jgi:hypothetical protein
MNNTDLTPAEKDEKKSPFNLPPLSDQTKSELKALGWAVLKGVAVAGAVAGTLAIAAALSKSDETDEDEDDFDAVDADEDE